MLTLIVGFVGLLLLKLDEVQGVQILAVHALNLYCSIESLYRLPFA